MRTGAAHLPLHTGKAPRWLFDRMTKLAGEISSAMVAEFGTEYFLTRLSDPFWFQAFGCVLGFDWHSSGVTTTVCGALKKGLEDRADELGVYVCGGKGQRPVKRREKSKRRTDIRSINTVLSLTAKAAGSSFSRA